MIDVIKRFGLPFRRELVLGPLSKLVEVGFDLCTPLVVALMIDRGVGTRDVRALAWYGALLAAMALAGFASTLICQKMASRASQGIGTALRDALFTHVNELSGAEIDRFGTPSLITRITNDVNQVQLAIALAIRQMTRFPLLAVGSMVAALLIDARLGVVFLIATPLIGLVFWLVMARCMPYFKRMQLKLDRIALITREGLSGARAVRAFVREGHERERFGRAAADQADVAIAVGRLTSLLNPATFLIMNLAVCAILWVGGAQVNVGALTQGQVMAFVNYMTQTLLAIVYVANLVVVFTRAQASAERIFEVLDCEPSVRDPAVAAECRRSAPVSQAIRLADVGFAYPGASLRAVEGVTLQVPAGGTLGVIGGTGSGKSTLAQLLVRLYDATEGSIEVLGEDVRSLPLGELRAMIGYVPQKAELVSGTIRSNLLWRDASASDAELWRALETAQAAEFIRRLPRGLDAEVEAGGGNFSGGQRQRLTIARALVGDPRVLVLDDASSALDLKTDAELRTALRTCHAGAALGGCTVVVSQRVTSVCDADVICVMRRGRAVGVGTHGQLLANCPVYREIVDSQQADEGVVVHG